MLTNPQSFNKIMTKCIDAYDKVHLSDYICLIIEKYKSSWSIDFLVLVNEIGTTAVNPSFALYPDDQNC